MGNLAKNNSSRTPGVVAIDQSNMVYLGSPKHVNSSCGSGPRQQGITYKYVYMFMKSAILVSHDNYKDKYRTKFVCLFFCHLLVQKQFSMFRP